MKIGIDLGTTNSAAARYEPDRAKAEIIAIAGEPLMRSAVGLYRDELLIGGEAINNAARSPNDTIVSVKRLMGRDFADPQIARVRDRFNYEVVPGTGGDPRVYVRLGGEMQSPTQISARILEYIKNEAGKTLGTDVTHAVITVPAYFTESQRAATREAGELAGLTVMRIIDEPTAAAVALGIEISEGEHQRILVFDMGGGTFDISILQTVRDQQGRVQHQGLQIEGDNWLGGDDFDFCIVDRIVDWMRSEHGTDAAGDSRFHWLAKDYAEQAKRGLSARTSRDIVIPAAFKLENGAPVDIDLTLTRDEFEAMIRPYVDTAMGLVRKCLSDQRLSPDDISDVLLVGGATLTPAVADAVEVLFGRAKIRRRINPMQCVALGAAVLAATLEGVACPACGEVNDDAADRCLKCASDLAAAHSIGSTIIVDPTPFSLGIRAVKGDDRDHFVAIIPKNTTYPLPEPIKHEFEATSDRMIRVPVYEGDNAIASKNTELGVIESSLSERINVRTRVEVSFNYDRNRVLTVTIAVPGTSVLETHTLARDRPRTPPPARESTARDSAGSDQWLDELERALELAQVFHTQYEAYMETNQTMRLQREMDAAERLLQDRSPDEEEGRHRTRVIEEAIFSSGLATQLYLADRATDGASPELSAAINEATAAVRESYDRGQRDQASRQAAQLKAIVAQVLQQRSDIQEVADQADYGGLLRALGE
jgi:molecular chaperone DnaK